VAPIPDAGRASEELLFAAVKVLPYLSQTRLLRCWAVFARAVWILDEPFLE